MPGPVEETLFSRASYILALLVLVVAILLPPAVSARAQGRDTVVLDGVPLVRTVVAGVELFHDPDIDLAAISNTDAAISAGLADVPQFTGLPPFTTPIRAFLLSDDDRFRLALAEIASVRVDLVAAEIGGYAIERDDRMLIFFAAPNVIDPASATVGFAHEFAHLAVREATQRRALPQWFNEGYASWISTQALAGRYPAAAALQNRLDRLAVASALHTRDLIPWSDLVTRTRFSRAGVDGLVNLAYGQSTLFVEFLAARHGTPALARFLTGIGEGNGATQAFSTAFGTAFGPESAAYNASLDALKAEIPPGLYVVQPATGERPAVFGLSGAPGLEIAIVEVLVDGEVRRRREIEIDGAGMMVTALPASMLDAPGALRLRVTSPQLGVLELDPLSEASVHPSVRPTGVPTPQPSPLPAPVQVPARTSSLPGWSALAA